MNRKSFMLAIVLLLLVGCSKNEVTDMDLQSFISEKNIESYEMIKNDDIYIFQETKRDLLIYIIKEKKKDKIQYVNQKSSLSKYGITYGCYTKGKFCFYVTNESVLNNSASFIVRFADDTEKEYIFNQDQKAYLIESPIINDRDTTISFFDSKGSLIYEDR
ncbi:hypothetical protein [Paenibacillus aquistagni]|uniref:hypothetical protein n=1 Tax=Paenibacillus aquistagni TaxID=1852522 RepID=UPI00145BE072|nr:hypothetical protein [Paenibacillus aquistagni]NMM54752.1 hypothetical protein [Paenibacillus aquistagni]